MQWTSVLAIYFLFFVFSAFILLPFGVRTHDEAGLEMVPGQADSAPAARSSSRGICDDGLRAELHLRLDHRERHHVLGAMGGLTSTASAPAPGRELRITYPYRC